MPPWLEIVIPVRNPGSMLLETGASLAAQTARDFAVVLSDNYSTEGREVLARFAGEMKAAGIPLRQVRPPYELGRVQHWNWAHSQAEAEWLKPLFVGDLLGAAYVERVRQRVAERPESGVVRCEFETRSGGSASVTKAPFAQASRTPAEFLSYFPALGNWLGGPINFAYRRAAWQAAGGYPPHLPACADYCLNIMLILHCGLEVIHEPLAVFQLHEQRFSHGIRSRRVNGSFEVWLILRQARNLCAARNLPWPRHGVLRGVVTQLKTDYWYPARKRVKKLLLGRG